MNSYLVMLAVALGVSIAASIIGWALRDRPLPDVEENPFGNRGRADLDNLSDLMRQDRHG